VLPLPGGRASTAVSLAGETAFLTNFHPVSKQSRHMLGRAYAVTSSPSAASLTPMADQGHLREALQWSRSTRINAVSVAVSAVCIGAPLLVAAKVGHANAGYAVALGAMLADRGTPLLGSLREQLKSSAKSLAPLLLSSIIAIAIAGHGIATEIALVGLISLSAAIGSASKTAATTAARFNPLLLIIAGLVENTSSRTGTLVLVLGGALLPTFAQLLARPLLLRALRSDPTPLEIDAAAAPIPATIRLSQKLRSLSAWDYPIRLAACLSAGIVLIRVWPGHRMDWVLLTVILTIRRQTEVLPVRVTQRALGTVAGVLIAELIMTFARVGLVVLVIIVALGALRPITKNRNYLLYSAVMTPLILLIVDRGGHSDSSVLADRLIATLIGAALVIAANLISPKLMRSSA
jgi:Fusaric acid resistance protein-like